jgi:lysozyme family protein
MANGRFAVCLPYTLAQECPYPSDWSNPKNFSNDPHDPGGATMCGITQREYNGYRLQHDLPAQPVERISQVEGNQIYYDSYWMPESPQLPVGLDLCYFDTSVNQGSGEATRILQTALGVDSDGIIGPQTKAAIKAISNVPAEIEAFTARREAVYKETRGAQYFLTDWMRRAEEIGAAAARAKVIQGHALGAYMKLKMGTP